MSPAIEIYGDTGNYRTLSEELQLGYDAGFDMTVHHIPAWHYEKTIDRWQSNMYEHRDRIKELTNEHLDQMASEARRQQENSTLLTGAARDQRRYATEQEAVQSFTKKE